MSNTTCFIGPPFSVIGNDVFNDQQPNFELSFNNISDQELVLSSEWFLDDLLIISSDILSFAGQFSNGDHTIGVRILTAVGWSGIKYTSFLNVSNADTYVLSGYEIVNEGASENYQVVAMYNGETIRDATQEFTFTSTEGYFSGSLYTAETNTISNDTRQITLTALKNGVPPITKQITIINTTPVTLTSLSIFGPSTVYEGAYNNIYTLYASYSDGTSLDKTIESVFNLLATYRGEFINNRLSLFSNETNNDNLTTKITGNYGGLSINYDILIVDTTPVTLISLTLNGPPSVDEGISNNVFQLLANYSDGTSIDKSAESTFVLAESSRGEFTGNNLNIFSNTITGDTITTNLTAYYGGLNTQFNITINDRSEEIIIDNFDYMAVRFNWVSGSGSDLDILVGFENNFTAFDNKYVGYGQPSTTIPAIASPQSNSYLWWALDNTGSSGYEGVLIGIKKFIDDHPSSPNIVEVGLYATWYRPPITGNFSVELVTYLGGTMSLSGNNFINTGGTLISSNIINLNTLNRPQGSSSPAVYFKIGTLKYDKITQTATIQITEENKP